METKDVVTALAALAQETRLRLFRLLIEYGNTGTPAGMLSEELGVPHNTLSFHLSHLSHAGLVRSRKEGRSVIYSADCEAVEGLIDYLGENCCIREGHNIMNCREGSDCGQGRSFTRKRRAS